MCSFGGTDRLISAKELFLLSTCFAVWSIPRIGVTILLNLTPGKSYGEIPGQTKIGTETPIAVTQLQLYDGHRPRSDPSRSLATRTIFLPACYRAFHFFLLFYFSCSFFFFRFQEIAFPATRAHKTKSVLHAYAEGRNGGWAAARWFARPFWSRQLSKSSGIVCDALCCSAEALATLLRNDSFSQSRLSFNPPTYTVTVAFGSRFPVATIFHVMAERRNTGEERVRIDDE